MLQIAVGEITRILCRLSTIQVIIRNIVKFDYYALPSLFCQADKYAHRCASALSN